MGYFFSLSMVEWLIWWVESSPIVFLCGIRYIYDVLYTFLFSFLFSFIYFLLWHLTFLHLFYLLYLFIHPCAIVRFSIPFNISLLLYFSLSRLFLYFPLPATKKTLRRKNVLLLLYIGKERTSNYQRYWLLSVPWGGEN